MAQTIKLRNSSVTTEAPAALVAGEVAINEQDELFFYRNGAGAVQTFDLTTDTSGFLPLSGGTVTGTLTVTGNLAVDNIDINGNTISSLDANGDIVFDPNGTGDVNVSSSKIINVTDPTSDQDAATKSYVDSVAQGLDAKDSVRVATTVAGGDIDLGVTADPGDIDGVTLADGDRILLKDQDAGAENGIYDAVTVIDPQTWVRSSDADSSAEVTAGMYVFVEEGTLSADAGFVLTTNDPIVLDTTALSFTQFSGAGQITAGAGMTKTGNTLDVGAGSGITVNANDIQISATYTGQGSIVTVGTIATGTWEGDVIDLARGGLGADTSGLAALSLLRLNAGQTAYEAAVVDTDYLDPSSTIDGGAI